MNQRRFSFKNAYGQLILLVFLPICFLALIGSFLVYQETRDANNSEQKALAQALLLKYQPIIRKRLPDIVANHHSNDNKVTGVNKSVNDEAIFNTNEHLSDILFAVQAELNLHRVALIDETGNVHHSAGYASSKPWFSVTKSLTDDFVGGQKTSVGTAYGLVIDDAVIEGVPHKLWLFVDMDSQPLQIAMYRITLALAITGLLTLLLLLLALNIYSRRWIAPIYELRLQLQRINADSISKGIDLRSSGEIKALNKDLTSAFNRLNEYFVELKQHSEETENDLNQTLDEMEAQNISMRHAQKEAESSSQAKSSFLANISHELRTPLNSIDGFINLLSRNDDLSDEHRLYIETIRKSSSHLLALVNDVLDFSKIEAGKLVLDSHDFDCYAAVYDVVDMLSPLANEKGLRMGVLFYNDVPLDVVGDELRLKQVLTNLVANAIKFTDSGEVLVRVSLDDNKEDFLRFAIQDSGKGVSLQNQRELFHSFSQGDPSITRQYGGTGLGLVISKQITHMMGGDIGFFDNDQANIATSGSTFWFEMPTNIDTETVMTAGDITIPDISNIVNNGFNNGDTIKMLVWLNHKANMQLLQACLRQLNIQVTQANSLAGTLEKLKEEGNNWHWVVVDSDTNETQDDMTALLKQVRLHYQGKLSVFGYQVALDTRLLSRYKAFALHEPLDKRQLYAMIDNRESNPNKKNQESLRWKGYRVLAVDDHLPNLLVLEALLAEQGIAVVTASNGFEAIEIVSKENVSQEEKTIDLIFMDIQMPRMSGKEASREIRNVEKANHRLPIIALTAQGISDERDSLIASGIDDYVGKPISQLHLMNVLQKWLPRKKTNNLTINHTSNNIKNQENTNSYVNNHVNTELQTEVLRSTAFSLVAEQHASQKHKSVFDRQLNNKRCLVTKNPLNLPKYLQQLLQENPQQEIGVIIASLTHLSYSIVVSLTENVDIAQFNKLPYSVDIKYLIVCNAVFTSHAIIDWQDGLKRSANKADLAAKLISMLIETISEEKKALINAWKAQDFVQLYQINHRLLGASQYAGVPQLRKVSQWLENNLYNLEVINECSNPLFLKHHYIIVVQAINNLLVVDLSPWPELRYDKLKEDDMVWKMM